MIIKTARPKFLNLLKIRLPVTGVTSILHRVSGVLLFISIPFVVYLFSLSLRGPEGFAEAAHWLDNPIVKVAALLLIWSTAHHFFTGIRFLLIDIDLGVELKPARISAWLTLGLGLLVLIAVMLWWFL